MIGTNRFLGRARSFFQRCFDGEVVEYSHALDDPTQTSSFLRCTMQPHFDSAGAVQGAIVTMTDISRELLKGVEGTVLVPVSESGHDLPLR